VSLLTMALVWSIVETVRSARAAHRTAATAQA
jgi:hypothetical protein